MTGVPELPSDDSTTSPETPASAPRARGVVIGLEDSTGARAALDWAVTVTASSGLPYTLAVAYPDVSQPPTWGWTDTARALEIEAGMLADDAEKQLTAAGVDPADIERVLRPESPVALLRHLSTNSRMLVLGKQGGGSFLDKLVGSTAYALAEHSQSPVVVVPEGWALEEYAHRAVVLGLDHGYDDAAITFAFDLARLMKRRLKVVHAVKLPPVYTAGELPDSAREEWLSVQRGWLADQLAPLHGQVYTDVEVDLEIVVGEPIDVLLWQATDAGMVVIGGKPRHRLVPAPLGSVAHALLRRCSTPMAIAHAE